MRYNVFVFSLLLLFNSANAQTDSSKKLWAFPITDYTTPLNDSNIIVQVVVPAELKLIKDKQAGVLRGVYQNQNADTATKGWGKCHLIKSDYFYFAIHLNKEAKPKAGDLIYTFIPASKQLNKSFLLDVAANAISFLDVDNNSFYVPEDFLQPTVSIKADSLVRHMADDIKRVGNYYLKEDASMNQPIPNGQYKGKKMLDVMSNCTTTDLNAFLRYVSVRPQLYAGNKWKISETFATWLMAGAPMVKE